MLSNCKRIDFLLDSLFLFIPPILAHKLSQSHFDVNFTIDINFSSVLLVLLFASCCESNAQTVIKSVQQNGIKWLLLSDVLGSISNQISFSMQIYTQTECRTNFHSKYIIVVDKAQTFGCFTRCHCKFIQLKACSVSITAKRIHNELEHLLLFCLLFPLCRFKKFIVLAKALNMQPT